AMNFNVNQIDLPEPYAKTTLVLVGPRVDLTLTKSLFLTTFLQYNNQTDNMNVNARLQWRYAPVSDLFLVYTDNYDTGNGFVTKNRALILKVNYWLNL
ncbi:MAG: hydrolase, partial [Chitinophagales bacterium]